VAWTGDKPAIGRMGLDTTVTAVAPTSTLYRNIDIKDVKGFAHCIKGLETMFGMKDDLCASQCSDMKHLLHCGIDVMESIDEGPNMFTKEYVIRKMGNYEARYDKYDCLNVCMASNFVHSS
jgi:hypothetical protein